MRILIALFCMFFLQTANASEIREYQCEAEFKRLIDPNPEEHDTKDLEKNLSFLFTTIDEFSLSVDDPPLSRTQKMRTHLLFSNKSDVGGLTGYYKYFAQPEPSQYQLYQSGSLTNSAHSYKVQILFSCPDIDPGSFIGGLKIFDTNSGIAAKYEVNCAEVSF